MPRLDVEAIRREQIVAAALAVLARRGFEGATMREIATAAGASTGMVTYHFASKEDVLRAALEEVAARFGRAVDAAVEGIEEPRAALLALHVLLHPAVATPATMRDAIRRHVAATLDVRA